MGNRLRSSATAKMFVEDVTAPPSETLPSDHEQPVASGVKVTVTGGKAPSGKTWQDVSSVHSTLLFLLLALFVGCICLLTLWLHSVHRPGPRPESKHFSDGGSMQHASYGTAQYGA